MRRSSKTKAKKKKSAKKRTPAESPPSACSPAPTATVSASPGSDRVRLAIRYTTSSPAAVEVEFFLRGRKGPLSFDDQRQRFGHAGVFHASAALTEAQMEKVLAAKSFRVQLHALSAPRSCDRYFDRNLSVRHASGRALTWSDPEASPRRGRRTAQAASVSRSQAVASARCAGSIWWPISDSR